MTAVATTAPSTYWSTGLDACNNGPSAATITAYSTQTSGTCLQGGAYLYTGPDKNGTFADSSGGYFGRIWYNPAPCGGNTNGQGFELTVNSQIIGFQTCP